MDKKEFDVLIKRLREKGLDDNKIMNILFDTFAQGKCSGQDLELMAGWLGFELNEELIEDMKKQGRYDK